MRYAGDVYGFSCKDSSILFDSVFNCNCRTLFYCSNNKTNEECFRNSALAIAYAYGRTETILIGAEGMWTGLKGACGQCNMNAKAWKSRNVRRTRSIFGVSTLLCSLLSNSWMIFSKKQGKWEYFKRYCKISSHLSKRFTIEHNMYLVYVRLF